MRSILLALAAVWTTAAAAQELKPWTGGGTPALVLEDLDGRLHRLESYRGKVVLINFWATWCEPCREEMPSIDRLQRSMNGRPFVVLAVNLAEPHSRIRTYLEKTPVGFTVLMDRDTSVAKAWKARILPATYVVGPDGRIRYSYVGELDWSQEKVRRAIAALLPP
ncbi:MAG TPA: TlpA disulfide reductase family protein [Burkholderiales bacterium]|nr:TlpA disulfide reductase family protein [Burkholderiales bacterium]